MLDSFLGGWFQASVIDSRTGKVIEGTGGHKASTASATDRSGWLMIRTQVLVTGSRIPQNKKDDEPSRHVESGLGILDNNAVNLLMAALMSVGGMLLASWMWHIPLSSMWS